MARLVGSARPRTSASSPPPPVAASPGTPTSPTSQVSRRQVEVRWSGRCCDSLCLPVTCCDITGVRTNLPLPATESVGLGGGSLVRGGQAGSVTVGPDSVGAQLLARWAGTQAATLTPLHLAMLACLSVCALPCCSHGSDPAWWPVSGAARESGLSPCGGGALVLLTHAPHCLPTGAWPVVGLTAPRLTWPSAWGP